MKLRGNVSLIIAKLGSELHFQLLSKTSKNCLAILFQGKLGRLVKDWHQSCDPR